MRGSADYNSAKSFDFDLALVMNVIAHEMVHVSQRAAKDFVEDKMKENGRLIMKCFFISAFLSYRNFPTFIKILCRQSLHILRQNG